MIATWTTSQKVPKKTTNYDVISFSEIVSRHFYVLIKFLFWDKISPFGDHKKVWWRAKRILSHKIWKCPKNWEWKTSLSPTPSSTISIYANMGDHLVLLDCMQLPSPSVTPSFLYNYFVPWQLSAIIINSMEFVVFPRVFLLMH
jgi:hypothetical protein